MEQTSVTVKEEGRGTLQSQAREPVGELAMVRIEGVSRVKT